MQVVARFYVSGIEAHPDGSATVKLSAVTSKENARWSSYTPNGQIQMSLTRKASGARDTFEAVVKAAREGGKPAECLVTFDFDAPPAEQPAYVQGEGYVSDE